MIAELRNNNELYNEISPSTFCNFQREFPCPPPKLQLSLSEKQCRHP
jgi:hypothetical protein